MKLAIIGASGFIGQHILTEALSRGHDVSALVRSPEKLPKQAHVTALGVDVYNVAELAEALKGHDAVISAFNPGHGDSELRSNLGKGTRSILAAVKQAGIQRILLVGGAGSLEIAPGLQLVDSPDFPVAWKAGALGSRDALEIVKAESSLDWTFLSPSAHIEPGTRTGKFRVGLDHLLQNEKGESRISTQDFSIAVLDEIEAPRFVKRRFTVGY